MKKFSAAVLIYLGLATAALAQQAVVVPATMASVAITASTAVTTLLVTGQPSKSIYITNWNIVAAGATSVQFIAGTGSTCGTNSVNLTGNYSLTAQIGLVVGIGNGAVLVAPQGDSVCIINSAAVSIPGSLAYAVF